MAGWNSLTPKQQAAFKKKNFNTSVKVPQSAIDKLNAGSKAANVKKYAGTTNKVMREAMNRYYGKGWDKGASVKKSAPAKGQTAPKNEPKGSVKPKSGGPQMRITGPGSRAKSVGKMSSKAKDAKTLRSASPTTSIGSFGKGGYEAAAKRKGFGTKYSKLSQADRDALNAGLSLMIPVGGGLRALGYGAKAVKGLAASHGAAILAEGAAGGYRATKATKAAVAAKDAGKAAAAAKKSNAAAKAAAAAAKAKKVKQYESLAKVQRANNVRRTRKTLLALGGGAAAVNAMRNKK